jgi:micrococcal nuclease
MQILSTWVWTAVAAIAIAQAPTVSNSLLVTQVVDGGTIEVQSIGRVHLLGIAAPRVERRAGASAPLGLEARDRLSSLVAGRWVKLEFDRGRQAGTTGRSAYVLLDDGTFVNAVLVREGLARLAGYPSLRRYAELQRAQEEAKRLERGLWNPMAVSGSQVYKTHKAAGPKGKKKKSDKARREPTTHRRRLTPHDDPAEAVWPERARQARPHLRRMRHAHRRAQGVVQYLPHAQGIANRQSRITNHWWPIPDHWTLTS